jgi:hypothetical protein
MNSNKNESRFFEAVEAGRGPPVNNGGTLFCPLLAADQIYIKQTTL